MSRCSAPATARRTTATSSPRCARAGLRHRRQDQHERVRHPAVGGAARVAAGAQPVRRDALDRRLERRLGVRGRGRHGPDRARQRRRRLDPHPGELLRPVRPEAEPRPRVVRAALRRRSTAASSTSTSSRASCATPRPCSTSSPACSPAIRTPRRRSSARTSPRSRRRPRKLRIGFATRHITPEGTLVESHPDCVAAVAHAAKLARVARPPRRARRDRRRCAIPSGCRASSRSGPSASRIDLDEASRVARPPDRARTRSSR